MCDPKLCETRRLALEMLPPTHVGVLGVPCEELDLVALLITP